MCGGLAVGAVLPSVVWRCHLLAIVHGSIYRLYYVLIAVASSDGWSVVNLELMVLVVYCAVNVVNSCFVLYLFVNCGFGNDESLQMTIGSHGQD